MTIDFFEKEVNKARKKFNQTFGKLTVCDLKLRQSAILAIGFMGALGQKIIETKNRDAAKEQIEKFMRTKKVLNSLFIKIEEHQKERRSNVIRNTESGGNADGRCAGYRKSRNLRKLRQHF